MTARSCQDCGAPIGRCSRGRCRPCSFAYLNSPEIRQRRKEGVRRYFQGEGKAAAAARLAKINANPTPAMKAAQRARGKANIALLNSPEVRAKSSNPEVRARAAATRLNTLFDWCPADRRDEYRRLTKTKRLSAAEARSIIEAEIAGTAEHARRQLANNALRMQLKRERELAQAY